MRHYLTLLVLVTLALLAGCATSRNVAQPANPATQFEEVLRNSDLQATINQALRINEERLDPEDKVALACTQHQLVKRHPDGNGYYEYAGGHDPLDVAYYFVAKAGGCDMAGYNYATAATAKGTPLFGEISSHFGFTDELLTVSHGEYWTCIFVRAQVKKCGDVHADPSACQAGSYLFGGRCKTKGELTTAERIAVELPPPGK